MDIEITLTKKIVVFGVEKRSLENLVWCAVTYGVNRLFWIDGYLFCLEVYEKSFEHEIKDRIFPISQICYASFPKYRKTYEIEKGLQIPIVDVSDTKMYRSILNALLENEKLNPRKENEDCHENCDCQKKAFGSFEQFIS
jgi:hypothetical protein